MRRIQKNTRDLSVGDVFRFCTFDDRLVVIAIGPDAVGYARVGYDADSDFAGIGTHETVCVDAPPRTTVGEYAVGERFRYGDLVRVLTVTAVGWRKSLVVQQNGDGSEFMLWHADACEEVPDGE